MHNHQKFPEFHDRSQLGNYVEPDYFANGHNGSLANLSAVGKSRHDEIPVIARVGDGAQQRVPTWSALGRGPRGEGLFVGNVVSEPGNISFALYSSLTGELVWQSPNLAAPVINFDVTDWRDLVPGVHAPLDIKVTRGGKTETTTAWLPSGQQGSLIYLYPDEIERNDDDTYAIPSESLMIYSRYDYPSKPAPRPNDVIFFRFRDDDGYGFAFGTIEDTGTLDTNVKPHSVDDDIVFTARTFIHIPAITVGSNGHWYVGSVDTGVNAQGPKGDKGDKGDPGQDGAAGERGPQGIQGPRGQKGDNGADGSDGLPFRLRNVTTVTGDPDTQASVVAVLVSQATNEYDMTITLPRGEDGISLDIQNGVYTFADLPPYTPTPVNTAFVVDDGDGQYDLYIRGRVPVDAEDGGPWVVIEDWAGGWDYVLASYGNSDTDTPTIDVTSSSSSAVRTLSFAFNGLMNYDNLINQPLVKHEHGTPLILDLDDIIANNEEAEDSTPALPIYVLNAEQKSDIITWLRTLSFMDPVTHQVSVSTASIDTTGLINNNQILANINLQSAYSILIQELNTSVPIEIDLGSSNGFLTISFGKIVIPLGQDGILTVYSDDITNPQYTATENLAIWNDISDKPDIQGMIDASIATAIMSVYKPAGSATFANLPTPAASVLGKVYNVTDAFTTDVRFVEGTGVDYPAGTNVVVVDTGTNQNPVYMFDVLAGYAQTVGQLPD